MTVRQLLVSMDAKELAEWMAYDRLEPFGEQRADLRSAMVCTIMANAWSGKGKRLKVDDFMPKFERQQKKQGWQHMKAVCEALARLK